MFKLMRCMSERLKIKGMFKLMRCCVSERLQIKGMYVQADEMSCSS